MATYIHDKAKAFKKLGDANDLPMRQRSESRMKNYLSATDARAWCHHVQDTKEYIVDLISAELPKSLQIGKYVPVEVLINTLMANKNADIARLKEQIADLENFINGLSLSPEERAKLKQIKNSWGGGDQELGASRITDHKPRTRTSSEGRGDKGSPKIKPRVASDSRISPRNEEEVTEGTTKVDTQVEKGTLDASSKREKYREDTSVKSSIKREETVDKVCVCGENCKDDQKLLNEIDSIRNTLKQRNLYTNAMNLQGSDGSTDLEIRKQMQNYRNYLSQKLSEAEIKPVGHSPSDTSTLVTVSKASSKSGIPTSKKSSLVKSSKTTLEQSTGKPSSCKNEEPEKSCKTNSMPSTASSSSTSISKSDIPSYPKTKSSEKGRSCKDTTKSCFDKTGKFTRKSQTSQELRTSGTKAAPVTAEDQEVETSKNVEDVEITSKPNDNDSCVETDKGLKDSDDCEKHKEIARRAVAELEALKNIIKERDDLKLQLEISKNELKEIKEKESCQRDIAVLEKDIVKMKTCKQTPELEMISKELQLLKKYCQKLNCIKEENSVLKRENNNLKKMVQGRSSTDSQSECDAGTEVGRAERERKYREQVVILNKKVAKLKQVTEERDMLKESVTKLENELSKYDDLSNEMEVFKKRSKVLDTVLEQREDLQRRLDSMSSLQNDLKVLKEKADKADKLEKLLDETRCQLANAIKESSKQQGKSNNLRDTTGKTLVSVCEMERLKRKEKELEVLRIERDKLKLRYGELSAMGQDYKCLQNKCRMLEAVQNERDVYKTRSQELSCLQDDYLHLKSQVEEAKSIVKERDCLLRRVRELECVIADQETEINRMVLHVDRLSEGQDKQQDRTKQVVMDLRSELDEKNRLIAESEIRLSCVQDQLKDTIDKLNCESTTWKKKVTAVESCNSEMNKRLEITKERLCEMQQSILKEKEFSNNIKQLLGEKDDIIGNMQAELEGILSENSRLQEIAERMNDLTDAGKMESILKKSQAAVRKAASTLYRQYNAEQDTKTRIKTISQQVFEGKRHSCECGTDPHQNVKAIVSKSIRDGCTVTLTPCVGTCTAYTSHDGKASRDSGSDPVERTTRESCTDSFENRSYCECGTDALSSERQHVKSGDQCALPSTRDSTVNTTIPTRHSATGTVFCYRRDVAAAVGNQTADYSTSSSGSHAKPSCCETGSDPIRRPINHVYINATRQEKESSSNTNQCTSCDASIAVGNQNARYATQDSCSNESIECLCNYNQTETTECLNTFSQTAEDTPKMCSAMQTFCLCESSSSQTARYFSSTECVQTEEDQGPETCDTYTQEECSCEDQLLQAGTPTLQRKTKGITSCLVDIESLQEQNASLTSCLLEKEKELTDTKIERDSAIVESKIVRQHFKQVQEHAKEQITDLSSHVQKYKEEKALIIAEKTDDSKELEELRKQLITMQTKLSECQEALQKCLTATNPDQVLLDEINRLRKQVEEGRDEKGDPCADIRKKLEEYKKNLADCMTEKSIKEDQDKDQDIPEVLVPREYEDISKALEDCRKQNAEIKNQLKDCQDKTKELVAQFQEVQNKNAELEKQLDGLDDLQKQLTNYEEENNKLKENVDLLSHKSLADCSDLEKQLSNCEKENEKLQKQVQEADDLRLQLQDAIKTNEGLKKHIEDYGLPEPADCADYIKQLEECKKKKDELEHTLDNLPKGSDCSEYIKQLEEAKEKMQGLMKEIAGSQPTNLSDLQKELDDCKRLNEELKSRLTNMKPSSEVEDLLKQLEDSRKQNDTLKNKLLDSPPPQDCSDLLKLLEESKKQNEESKNKMSSMKSPEEYESLRKQLDDCKNKLGTMKSPEECDGLLKQLEDCKKQMQEMKDKIEDMKSAEDYNKLLKQLEECQKNMKKMKSEEDYNNLQSQLDDCRKKETELKDQLRAMKSPEDYANLEKQMDDCKAKLKTMKSQEDYENLQKQLEDCKKQMQELKDKIGKMKSSEDYENLQKQMQELKDKIGKMKSSEDYENLQKQLQECKDKMGTMKSSDDYRNLQKQLDDSKATMKSAEDYNNLQKQLDDCKNKLTTMKSADDYNNLLKQLEDCKKQAQELKDKISTMKSPEDYNNLLKQVDDCKTKLATMKSPEDYANLQKQLEDNKSKLTTMKSSDDYNNLLRQLEDCRKQVQDLNNKISTMKTPEDYTNLLKQLGDSKKQAEDLNSRITSMRNPDDFNNLQKQLDDCKKQMNDLKTQLASIPPPVDCSEYIRKLDACNQQLTTLKGENTALKDKVASIPPAVDCSEYIKKLEACLKESEQMKQKITTAPAATDCSDYIRQLESCRKEIDDYKTRLSGALGAQAELDNLRKQLDTCRSDLAAAKAAQGGDAGLRKQLEDNQSALETCRNELANYKRQLDDCKMQLQDCRASMEECSKQLDGYKKQLDDYKDQLSKANATPAGAGAQAGGPQSGGPQAGGPQAGGPQAGGPQPGGPQAGAPQVGGQQAGGPQAGGPQAGGPQEGGPQAGGPQAGGPQAGGPQAGGPQAGGPQAGGPSQADLDSLKKQLEDCRKALQAANVTNVPPPPPPPPSGASQGDYDKLLRQVSELDDCKKRVAYLEDQLKKCLDEKKSVETKLTALTSPTGEDDERDRLLGMIKDLEDKMKIMGDGEKGGDGDLEKLRRDLESEREKNNKLEEALDKNDMTGVYNDCKKRLAELEAELKNCEAERDKMRAKLTDLEDQLAHTKKSSIQAIRTTSDNYKRDVNALQNKYIEGVKQLQKSHEDIIDQTQKDHEAEMMSLKTTFEEELLSCRCKQYPKCKPKLTQTCNEPLEFRPLPCPGGDDIFFNSLLQKILQCGLETLTFEDLQHMHTKVCDATAKFIGAIKKNECIERLNVEPVAPAAGADNIKRRQQLAQSQVAKLQLEVAVERQRLENLKRTLEIERTTNGDIGLQLRHQHLLQQQQKMKECKPKCACACGHQSTPRTELKIGETSMIEDRVTSTSGLAGRKSSRKM